MKGRRSRRERDALALQLFVKRYARKAPRGGEPNDRSYDRNLPVRARRMKPDELDALLRDGEDQDTRCDQQGAGDPRPVS